MSINKKEVADLNCIKSATSSCYCFIILLFHLQCDSECRSAIHIRYVKNQLFHCGYTTSRSDYLQGR